MAEDSQQYTIYEGFNLLVFIIHKVDTEELYSLKIASAARFIYGTISGEQPCIHMLQSFLAVQSPVAHHIHFWCLVQKRLLYYHISFTLCQSPVQKSTSVKICARK